jgi:putative component of toxin-antitoxin plasmid stabilization module
LFEQFDGRLAKIRLDGYFGNHKSVSHKEKGVLKDKVWELKFNDGRRIYYAYIPEKNILLLLGGIKMDKKRTSIKRKNSLSRKRRSTQKGNNMSKK